MKETVLISTIVIFIYIFLFSNHRSLVYIEAHTDGNKYLVNNDEKKYESAELLARIISNLYQIRDHLIQHKDENTEFKEYIELLESNFNKDRTSIYENSLSSQFTSYAVNKGEEIVFCLRSKKTNKLHKENLIMYVALHEMAHLACPEIGHGELFKKIFSFLTRTAMNLGLYYKEDYDSNPVEYCGMILSSSIV